MKAAYVNTISPWEIVVAIFLIVVPATPVAFVWHEAPRLIQKQQAVVRDAYAVVHEAQAKIAKLRSQRRIACSCGARHRICDIDLLVTHWYTQPHGCTGGDYWSEGEWNFVCQKCGIRNRLLFDDYKVDYFDRRKIGVAAEPTFKDIYRALFKSRKDVYDGDDHDKVPFQNNFYADQHRKAFELPLVPGKK